MKSERGSYEAFLRGAHQPPPPSPPLTNTPSPNSAPRASGDGRGASAPLVPSGAVPGEEGRGDKMATSGSGWVPPHDVVTQLSVQEGAAGTNDVGGARGGASQGESIQTMHRLLTQGRFDL